jgi:hypothetical protein
MSAGHHFKKKEQIATSALLKNEGQKIGLNHLLLLENLRVLDSGFWSK